MLIIPLRMESALETRPFVSLIIGLAIVYQGVVLPLFPSLQIHQGGILQRQLYEPAFWNEFALSLFRGGSPLAAFFLATFWLVIGRGLEHRMGPVAIVVLYLLGALVVYIAAWTEIVRMEKHLWMGLGGTLMCMGAAYYHAWEDDVTFFYLLLSPFHISAGFSSTASLFLIAVIQLVLSITQLPAYGRDEIVPPGFVSAGLFTLTLPIIIALFFIVSGILTKFAFRRQNQSLEIMKDPRF